MPSSIRTHLSGTLGNHHTFMPTVLNLDTTSHLRSSQGISQDALSIHLQATPLSTGKLTTCQGHAPREWGATQTSPENGFQSNPHILSQRRRSGTRPLSTKPSANRKTHASYKRQPLLNPTDSSKMPEPSYIETAFKDGSFHPSPALRKLLDDILTSSFVRFDTLEPLIGDYFGILFLLEVQYLPGCPSTIDSSQKDSLYTLFIKRPGNICLLCGKSTTCLNRALGCVRAHLQHRPFKCTGCLSCSFTNGRRFSTSTLLEQHITRQENKLECPLCGTKIRCGGMQRHRRSMHSTQLSRTSSTEEQTSRVDEHSPNMDESTPRDRTPL